MVLLRYIVKNPFKTSHVSSNLPAKKETNTKCTIAQHKKRTKTYQNIPKQLISQTIPGTVSYSNDATACHQELRSFAATPMDGTSAKLEPPSQVGWKNKEAKIGNSKFHRNWVHQTNQTHSKSCRRKNDLL